MITQDALHKVVGTGPRCPNLQLLLAHSPLGQIAARVATWALHKSAVQKKNRYTIKGSTREPSRRSGLGKGDEEKIRQQYEEKT